MYMYIYVYVHTFICTLLGSLEIIYLLGDRGVVISEAVRACIGRCRVWREFRAGIIVLEVAPEVILRFSLDE